MKPAVAFFAALFLPGFTIGSVLHSKVGYNATEEIIKRTDDIIFNLTMADFEAARFTALTHKEDPSAFPENEMDWNSDGCTMAPDEPFGFDFRPAC
jgi:hypothetical protein